MKHTLSSCTRSVRGCVIASAIFFGVGALLWACGGDGTQVTADTASSSSGNKLRKPTGGFSAIKMPGPGLAKPAFSGILRRPLLSAHAGSASVAPPAPPSYWAVRAKERATKITSLQCSKLSDAVEKLATTKKTPLEKKHELVKEAAKSPIDGLTKPNLDECVGLVEEEISDAQIGSLLQSIVKATVAYKQQEPDGAKNEFCPSAKAVPAKLADVEKARYKAKQSDIEDEGWKCLKQPLSSLETLVGQVEYKLAADKKSVEAIVRRANAKAGEPASEYYLGAKIGADGDVQVATKVEIR